MFNNNNNNNNYNNNKIINKLEFAVAPPQSGSSSTDSRWNLEVCVSFVFVLFCFLFCLFCFVLFVFVLFCFLWREENRKTRRKILGARTRRNNKLKPHMAPRPGIYPMQGHISGRQVPSPLCHPCFLDLPGLEVSVANSFSPF